MLGLVWWCLCIFIRSVTAISCFKKITFYLMHQSKYLWIVQIFMYEFKLVIVQNSSWNLIYINKSNVSLCAWFRIQQRHLHVQMYHICIMRMIFVSPSQYCHFVYSHRVRWFQWCWMYWQTSRVTLQNQAAHLLSAFHWRPSLDCCFQSHPPAA